jgi:hypothetical protein
VAKSAAAAFLERREPFGPPDPETTSEGVDGLEVSGVTLGVASVEVPLPLWLPCWATNVLTEGLKSYCGHTFEKAGYRRWYILHLRVFDR